MARPAPKYLLIGEILRPHGVRGELRMRVITEYPERIAKLKKVYLGRDPYDPKLNVYEIADVRWHHEVALVTFKNVDDRDAADRLRQLSVMVAIEDAVPLEDGEVYLFEIIGMRAVTEDGQDLGEISDIIEAGPNDIFVITGEKYGEFTVPDVPQFIVRIDRAARHIVIRPIDGLIPDIQ